MARACQRPRCAYGGAAIGDPNGAFLNKDSLVPLEGAFKVPSLRGLKDTAPYFHDGRFRTLRAVLDHYNHPPPIEKYGAHELRELNLSGQELLHIEQFLFTLSD
jgi:cytochrome c peroxidase